MPDKLTDSDIVKALECCSSGDTNCCNKCPLDKECGVSIPIMEELMKYALDLINRLQAENERLKDYNENLLTANTALSNEILDVKAEAYKEFADRYKELIKQYWFDYPIRIFCDEVDNLLKELVGEDNG